jgi:nitroreductase
VCGKLQADEDVDTIYARAPDEIRQRIGGICEMVYGRGEQMRRDEAIRGASLAAMSMMYSAKAKGFETGPMIGYDPQQVAELVGLPSNYIPVMMVVMGRGEADGVPRAGRRPLSEVVKLESFSAGSLS